MGHDFRLNLNLKLRLKLYF